ncbi:MAG: M15 family metallopeptidase [Amylibacter sp.]
MRFLPYIIIGAILLLVAPLLWLAIQSMDDGGSDFKASGPGIDSGARIEIEVLRQQVEGLKAQIEELRKEVGNIETSAVSSSTAQSIDQPVVKDGPNAILDAYAKVVLIANRRKVNPGINVASPTFLEQFLGRPREVLSDNCEPMTNPKLKKLLVLENIGPIRVRMLQPAADSIKRVFAKVQAVDPDLYARINTSGSLCVRQIRGTRGRTSTHAFGLAVDLNIDGRLDNFADGKTQLGLTILADFFREEGWVWGAGFSREDSMHFEVSKQMLEQWRKEGKI